MSGLPWFKCYPRDFNDGMVGLTLEERGAYVTILNLIYSRGGPIPEDAWWITSQLGCTKRAWIKVRAALIIKRKLYAVSVNGVDSLMNGRAAAEIDEREKLSEIFSDAGSRGGRNSQAKRSKNNGKPQATLDEGLSQSQAIQIQNSDTDITDDSSASARFSDWDGEDLNSLESLLREAAGNSVNVASAKLHVVAPVLGLMRPGAGPACDLNADVLPAIRAAAARVRKPVDHWGYFAPMIAEARDRRLQGAPAVADVVPLRATGPPTNITDRISAEHAEARRRALES